MGISLPALGTLLPGGDVDVAGRDHAAGGGAALQPDHAAVVRALAEPPVGEGETIR